MVTTIQRADVQLLLEQGAQLVEVLPEEEYEFEHLPGAINLPLKSLSRQSASMLDPGRRVIVYCNDQL
jgi:rhodanese-related sulfurtransferase